MGRHFALTVHLHDRRYHGADEWPPAPARVFQSLVAGAAQGCRVPEDAARALMQLERLAPPVIAAPAARRGQRLSLFVPNNDLDAVGADPERVGEVRTKKAVWPYLLESEAPFLYAWPLPEPGGEGLVSLADGLYQLGRGVDPAWAVGELLDDEQLWARLRVHSGTVHRPAAGDGANELAVPAPDSFGSLVRRFEAGRMRLRPSMDGEATNFVQPPKAQFRMVGYDGTPAFHLFELRREAEPARSSPWAAWCVTSLVELVRNTAVAVLTNALPDHKADIDRVLVGRKPDGSNAGPIEERVRFIPLPSIGHEHADQSVRRVLVQVPQGPIAEGDVLWALAGRSLFDPETGEVEGTTLAGTASDQMVDRYRVRSRSWRSVTPLALGSAPRRRIEPKRQREESKSATEREAEEQVARHAIAQALRHAGVEAALVRAHVQKEAYDRHGTRAERFAEGTRFAKETLWHAEVEFDREVGGPLVLGDGRFLGLGLMAPRSERGVFAFAVTGGLPKGVEPTRVARALRRALMARAQATLGRRGSAELPAYFHGHTDDESGSESSRSTHLAFSVDVPRSRLLVVAPHILDGLRRPSREDAPHLETLGRAIEGFVELRAGEAGVLPLRASPCSSSDPLLNSSRVFRSVTDYVANRHAKGLSAEDAVITDVRRECDRRGLPRPSEVRVARVRGVARVGLAARVELRFRVAVRGPLLLGKTRYLGGGLFEPMGRGRHEDDLDS
ncbi:MAG: type I-U CRISPR-associated protein Cas5/Cas6 [Deltaproteobacteria bacterium]|nr:type I-U CRISPR-associated protein Cas5/Cas6 [Deltaproteobacteria bacterium]